MANPLINAAEVTQSAVAALNKGDAARACGLIDQLIVANRADASAWLVMAHARAILGDQVGKIAALDRALELDPNDLRALLAKADHLMSAGDARAASAYYSAALRYLPRADQLPPHLQEALRRAQSVNARMARELEDFVRSKLEADGLTAAHTPRRFANAVDVLFGKKRAYVQEPQYFYYPELPQIQFYERAEFPWLDALEAATADIRKELQQVAGGDFGPYLTQQAGRPKGAAHSLVDNPGWSAFFLYKDGVERPGAARCPRTMAALAGAPLTRIPERAPSILFSKLAAGAAIPPHTGMLNARLICHLPLIVPPGCDFRVGNDLRSWAEGRAWVFDDTIEHEAWNRSGQDRYVLLFDIWRPELTQEERLGVAALCQAIDAYRGKVAWDN